MTDGVESASRELDGVPGRFSAEARPSVNI